MGAKNVGESGVSLIAEKSLEISPLNFGARWSEGGGIVEAWYKWSLVCIDESGLFDLNILRVGELGLEKLTSLTIFIFYFLKIILYHFYTVIIFNI